MSLTIDTEIPLSGDQQKAYEAFFEFLDDPDETFFTITGGAGRGKSTLLKAILKGIEKRNELDIMLEELPQIPEPKFCATTNKAAENLYGIVQQTVSTIHSFLGLRLNPATKKLVEGEYQNPLHNELIFIDEAGCLDQFVMGVLEKRIAKGTKIVFIGDPYQLTPINSKYQPAFSSKYKGVHLDEPVRQAKGNPIIGMVDFLQDIVKTGEWGSFPLDGHHLKHLDQGEFASEIIKEFTRPDWKHNDSKILCWSNAKAIEYNNNITELIKGSPEFQVGDYAICNSFISKHGVAFRTNQTVRITDIHNTTSLDFPGKWVSINGHICFFLPDKYEYRKQAIQASNLKQYAQNIIDTEWIDLRASYAETVDKSQGSTYDKVFIDIDDIAKCTNSDRVARMLYVAVSRARHQVILKGDLV